MKRGQLKNWLKKQPAPCKLLSKGMVSDKENRRDINRIKKTIEENRRLLRGEIHVGDQKGVKSSKSKRKKR
jgi:hypothetical protein